MESLGLQLTVNSILELQSLAKVKPKGWAPDTKNKKRSIAQVDLEGSTYWDLSRFEHKAKVRRIGIKSQDKINARGRKRED